MRFRLRDVFWAVFLVALACLLWRTRTHNQRLAMEARYYRSAAPPIALIDEPFERAIETLEAKHNVKIDVDWPSVTKATRFEPQTRVTQNLEAGSLTWAIERLFFGHAVVEGTDRGILVRGRDPKRDGPRKPDWETSIKRKAKPSIPPPSKPQEQP